MNYCFVYKKSDFSALQAANDGYLSPVDQTPAQEFNVGSNGFPQSDITALMNANSRELYESILAGMRELEPEADTFDEFTDLQRLQLLKPRLLQDPVELKAYYQFVTDYVKANSEPISEPTPEPTSVS